MRYLFYPLLQQPLLPMSKIILVTAAHCRLPPPLTSCHHRRCMTTLFTISPFSSFFSASLPPLTIQIKQPLYSQHHHTTPHHLATLVYHSSDQPPLLTSLMSFSAAASLSSCHLDMQALTTTVLCFVVP